MNKNLVVVVAVITVLVLGIGGGTIAALVAGSGDDSSSAPTERPSTDSDDTEAPAPSTPAAPAGPVPAGLEGYYSQQLAWEPCGSNECALLEVPVDYQEPEGDNVRLKVERVPAGDPGSRVGSLVVNPGGPGAPGTTMAESATGYFRPQLLSRVDIVAFDPRGTGESDPVDCLSDEELDEFIAQDPSPDDAAEGEEVVANQDAFFAGCLDSSDALVGHVSTVEAARDMDVLRAVLGEEKLSYLGFSYGTTLGSTYASLFPA
ncbi:MAG: caeA 1, partial [Nocardioides sp.]|nr:caeA 1 [Nocardioides sp.]